MWPASPRLAAAVLAAALVALAAGAPALETLRRMSGQPDVCPFRARYGRDCLGCGGTRAFADGARGRIVAGFYRNPMGAAAAAFAWASVLAATLSLLRRSAAPLVVLLLAGVPVFALTVVVHAACWWRSLPPGVGLR
jgi:hypothetical protein